MLKSLLDDLDSISGLAGEWGGGMAATIFLLAIGLILWWARRGQKAEDKAKLWGRIGLTTSARFHEELPESIHILSAFGTMSDAQVLRTTWGLRLVSAIVSAGIFWLLWGDRAGQIVPTGMPTVGVTLVPLVAIAELWLFRAHVDATGLCVRRFGVWRRSWLWTDLTDIRHDGGYEMVLDFGATGRARVWKHLAGIDRLLRFAGEALDRNNPTTCPNFPKSRQSVAGWPPLWRDS
jgi:hypothetical protein